MFKEARKGFLTARRMVPNVLASKLPARKSRNIARDSMHLRVVSKHDRVASGNGLKMPGPSSVFDESVVYRRRNKKSKSQKQSGKSSSGTKLTEKGRKKIFQERKEEGEVSSPASRKA